MTQQTTTIIMKELLNNRLTMTMIIIIITTLLYVSFGTDKQDTTHEIVSMLGRGAVIIIAIVSGF